MDILFEPDKIMKYFNDLNLLNKKVGTELTKTIKRRYDALRAAESFQIYLTTGLGKPHRLHGDLEGCFAICVSGNCRLIVKPKADNLMPDTLKSCNTIIIKGVEDYHGGKQEWLIP